MKRRERRRNTKLEADPVTAEMGAAMKTKAITGYAVRVVLFLASHKGIRPKSEIARQTQIPPGFCNKLMQELKNSHVVESVPGQFGGYRLAVNPAIFSLYDIYCIFEAEQTFEQCKICGDSNCTLCMQDCPICTAVGDIRAYCKETLSAQTLTQILQAKEKGG